MKTAIQFLGTALSVLLLVPTFLTGCGRNSSHSGDDFKSVGVAVVQMSDHTTANEDATVQTVNRKAETAAFLTTDTVASLKANRTDTTDQGSFPENKGSKTDSFVRTLASSANDQTANPVKAAANASPSLQALSMETETLGTFRYWLYTPSDPTDDMPLIVYLHGGSGKGDDLNLITSVDGFPKYLQDGTLGDIPAYVIIPQLPSSKKGWTDVGADLMSLIRYICNTYNVSSSRVSLTGHSMGGTGTWGVAAAYPASFSKIAPCSGSINNTTINVNKLKGIPVRAFVGSADTIVSPDSSINFVAALKQAGGDAEVTVFDGAGHFEVPALVYLDENIAIVDWLLSKPCAHDGLPCDGGDTCPGNIFTDMPTKGHWAHDAIDWAIVHGITAGTSATTFSPNAGCTRAQVVTFLWRAAGNPKPTTASNPFKDVKEGTYYYKAVLWAAEAGVTAGTSATTFSPDATCTRGQIVTFIWHYEGTPEATITSNPFTDVQAGAYYEKAVLWASETGVTAGTSATTFSPNATCTRAQIVTFLYRDLAE